MLLEQTTYYEQVYFQLKINAIQGHVSSYNQGQKIVQHTWHACTLRFDIVLSHTVSRIAYVSYLKPKRLCVSKKANCCLNKNKAHVQFVLCFLSISIIDERVVVSTYTWCSISNRFMGTQLAGLCQTFLTYLTIIL